MSAWWLLVRAESRARWLGGRVDGEHKGGAILYAPGIARGDRRGVGHRCRSKARHTTGVGDGVGRQVEGRWWADALSMEQWENAIPNPRKDDGEPPPLPTNKLHTRINHDAPLPPSPACAPPPNPSLLLVRLTQKMPQEHSRPSTCTRPLYSHLLPPPSIPAASYFGFRTPRTRRPPRASRGSWRGDPRPWSPPSPPPSPRWPRRLQRQPCACRPWLRLLWGRKGVGDTVDGGYGAEGVERRESDGCVRVCVWRMAATDGLREHFSGKPYFEYS